MKVLKEKYGIMTAIAMVVGIVIGSGVFFKADNVLIATDGNLPLALFAWFIGGMIMVISAFTFSLAARKVSKSNGIVDYIESGYGKSAGYYVGWFMAYIYYPSLTGILAWIAGLYTATLLNLEGNALWYLAFMYLVVIVVMNALSPIISGKFQISATVIKLIPIVLVAIFGTIFGLANGITVNNFTSTATVVGGGGGLATAVLATAFAYEGWIVATSINAELKDDKKTLPKALVLGSLIIISAYMLYYLGLAGTLDNQVFANQGDNAVNTAVNLLFGGLAGTALTVFVIISCLGTLNGLVLGTSRSIHSIAMRDMGFASKFLQKVTKSNNAPLRAISVGFIIAILWSLIWFGNFAGWFGGFLDISELPIAFLYAIYIAVYVWIMRTFKEANVFERFIAPSLALLGSLYIIFAAIQKDMFMHFIILLAIIFLLGYIATGNLQTLFKKRTLAKEH